MPAVSRPHPPYARERIARECRRCLRLFPKLLTRKERQRYYVKGYVCLKCEYTDVEWGRSPWNVPGTPVLDDPSPGPWD